MRTHRLLLPLLLVAALDTLPAAEDAAKPFRPDASFPRSPLLYASVSDVDGLAERLGGTLIGRIATHPGTRAAFRGLAAKVAPDLEKAWAPFVARTGKTPLEILGLLRGQVAFCLRGIGPGGVPEMALAVELGETRADLLALVERLKKDCEESIGRQLETRDVSGLAATVWPSPMGETVQVVLGDFLVAATTPELLATIASAHAAGGDGAGPGVLEPAALEELGASRPEALLTLNVGTLRTLLLAAGGGGGPAQAKVVLQATGLDRLKGIVAAAGFRDGGLEVALQLGLTGKASGILGAVLGGFPAMDDPGEALAQVPKDAFEVRALRLNLGAMLRDLDARVRQGFPDLGPRLDAAYDALEKNAGISFQGDLLSPGDLTAVAYRADPPAGGLFADEVVIARTEALEPYWRLLRKAAAAGGIEPRTLDEPEGKIEYLSLAGSRAAGTSPFLEYFRSGQAFRPSGAEAAVLVGMLMVSSVPSRVDLPGGWTAVSGQTQSLVRHIRHRAKGPRLSEDPEFAAFVRERLQGSCGAVASRGARSFLWGYNSLVGLACDLGPFLAFAGIDPSALPPAEAFLDLSRPGSLQVRVGPAGITLRAFRPGEVAPSPAAVAVGAIGAGVLVPALMRGRGEAYKVQCANNLKQLFQFSMAYSDKSGKRAHPYSPGGSLAALRTFVDFDSEGLSPKLFVCPEGEEEPAALDADGRFLLDDVTCSYEIVPWPMKNTAQGILMYDRRPCHGGGRNVLFSDGAVQFMSEADFQASLARDREKFAKPSAAKVQPKALEKPGDGRAPAPARPPQTKKVKKAAP